MTPIITIEQSFKEVKTLDWEESLELEEKQIDWEESLEIRRKA